VDLYHLVAAAAPAHPIERSHSLLGKYLNHGLLADDEAVGHAGWHDGNITRPACLLLFADPETQRSGDHPNEFITTVVMDMALLLSRDTSDREEESPDTLVRPNLHRKAVRCGAKVGRVNEGHTHQPTGPRVGAGLSSKPRELGPARLAWSYGRSKSPSRR
jgi:hypothetical protein